MKKNRICFVLVLLSALIALISITACRPRVSAKNISLPLIVGGQELEDEHPGRQSAVLLLHKGQFRCSAVLVAKDILLTASHCLKSASAEDFSALFGDSIADQNAPTRQVTEIRLFRPWQRRASARFDIAWLRLATDAPESYQPVAILTDPAQLKPGTELLVVGYGRTSSTSADYGQRLTTDTVVNRFEDSPLWRYIFVTGPTPGRGTCNGDSGGPTYVRVEGQWLLAGILYGAPPELLPGTVCEDGQDVQTFTGQYLAWIEQTTKRDLAEHPSILPSKLEARKSLPTDASNFLRWCHTKNLADEPWYTVALVMTSLGAKTCDDAAKRLAEIDRLDLNFAAIQDLRPLQAEANLKTLLLAHSNVSDLTPLKNLKKLQRLNLAYSNISNIDALKGLKDLKFILLHNNHIASLASLGELPDIEEIVASCNLVRNVEGLAAASKLSRLDLANNQLLSIDSLLKKMSLTRLVVWGNPLVIAQDTINDAIQSRGLLIHANYGGPEPECSDSWTFPDGYF